MCDQYWSQNLTITFYKTENFDMENGVQYYLGTLLIDYKFQTKFCQQSPW